jgi:hypothetical protein
MNILHEYYFINSQINHQNIYLKMNEIYKILNLLGPYGDKHIILASITANDITPLYTITDLNTLTICVMLLSKLIFSYSHTLYEKHLTYHISTYLLEDTLSTYIKINMVTDLVHINTYIPFNTIFDRYLAIIKKL